MGKRTVEFVLGLIGGILGFIIIFSIMGFISAGDVILGTEGSETSQSLISSGWWGILFSIIGIVGASIVKNKTKVAGWMMIVAAVGGIFSAGLFFLLPFVLLIIAGLMALIKKGKK
jgi:hypothetical protein